MSLIKISIANIPSLYPRDASGCFIPWLLENYDLKYSGLQRLPISAKIKKKRKNCVELFYQNVQKPLFILVMVIDFSNDWMTPDAVVLSL